MGYIGTSDLESFFANEYTFGTSGTNICTPAQAELNITRASAFIDWKLSNLYGTIRPIFGTNAYGTTNCPDEIRFICADIAMSTILENRSLYINSRQGDFGTMLYQRAMDWLDALSMGENGLLSPFSGTITGASGLPIASGNTVKIYGEVLTLNGTEFTGLKNKEITGAVTVYGTQDIGYPTYTVVSDYEVFKYGDTGAGTNYGMIRTHGTGSLTSGATVRVDYSYYPSKTFTLNDYLKWGEANPERRG